MLSRSSQEVLARMGLAGGGAWGPGPRLAPGDWPGASLPAELSLAAAVAGPPGRPYTPPVPGRSGTTPGGGEVAREG
jgi:hypothetical protein